ncbi:SOS response-associated peptidase [Corynebacterium heidelbergense]|uniref:Abasic site processing protein n=1 Tax=Corynebacterium heidelbergense TaxID=2055947 RepID=A0A364V5S2_9CORY|nr:SOS response-associated peptidase [Corynebacterium heidelbergense]RAV31987.1 SOS response-associated peptidase [Corynebacterium heidelbergense]
MCGRYVLFSEIDDVRPLLSRRLGSAEVPVVGEQSGSGMWRPNYNVAPSHVVPIVRPFRQRPTIGPARWGYPPKTVFNARGETVLSKPLFRGSRPCLFVMDGWYEWTADGAAKQPWFTSSSDGEPLLVAGMCKLIEGQLYGTIVTTAAPEDMAWLHHRMPRVLVEGEEDEAAEWLLGTPTTAAQLAARPGAQHWPQLESQKVSRAVGNVANNGPELLEPE